jgi:hypothetical protein
MTAGGLRREAAKGNLAIERIAGKYYTTLHDIDRMRELCRVEAKAPISGSDLRVAITAAQSLPEPPGSSSTTATTTPQAALRAKLNARKPR